MDVRGSMLPHDLRKAAEASVADRQGGSRGIGGAAPENKSNSEARAHAMGDVRPQAESSDTKAEETPKIDKCPNCNSALQEEWAYCPKCRCDILRKIDPIKRLGIPAFTDEDLQDYIFKGFIIREIPILGGHKVVIKSSQPSDMKESDDLLTNNEAYKKPMSEALFRQLALLSTVAVSIQSFDGAPIGKTTAEKMTWLENHGSALVDMLTDRVQLLNIALTSHLEKKNTVLGS